MKLITPKKYKTSEKQMHVPKGKEQTKETIEMTTVAGLVIKMGDLCYKDIDRFPNGAWCKEGQFVIYGRYSGARFKTKYGEHRILNDDEIIGTIKKPEDILALF